MDDYVLEVPQGFLMSDEAAMDTEGGSATTHFAALRLYIKAVIPYSTGQFFTLPGVYRWREDKENGTWVKEGLHEFRPYILGGNKSRLFIMVANETNKDGKEYQRVKMFKSWQEKDKDYDPVVKHFEWQTHQLPAIREMPADVVTSFEAGKVIYAKYEVLPTNRQFKYEGKDTNATYWGNFQVYPNLDALMAAKKEHFGGLNGSNGTDGNIPDNWKQSPAVLMNMIQASKGGDYLAKAKELLLIGNDGKIVNRENSEVPVNLPELFAKALGNDFPAAMLEDVFAPDKIAEFLKKK